MNITYIYLVTNCYNDPNKVYIGKTKNTRKNNIRQSSSEKKPEEPEKDIYFLSNVIPKDLKMFISKVYSALQKGRRVVLVGITPKDFLVKLMTKYSGFPKEKNLSLKLNFILKELFPNYKFNKITSLKDQGVDLSRDNIKKISDYINRLYAYINNQEIETILVPEDRKEFVYEIMFIHNNILDKSKFNKNLSQSITSLKNKVRSIVEFYEIGKFSSKDGIGEISSQKQTSKDKFDKTQDDRNSHIIGTWSGDVFNADGSRVSDYGGDITFLEGGTGYWEDVPFAWKFSGDKIEIATMLTKKAAGIRIFLIGKIRKSGDLIIKVDLELSTNWVKTIDYDEPLVKGGYIIVNKTSDTIAT